jgi:rhodanese-related sulfurtransferase
MSSIEIDCQAVKSKLDSADEFLLLDCREQSEWDHVHIDEAALLPMSEIQNRVSELDDHRDGEVIVYCHHGGRSLQVAMWLKQQGFSNVLNMTGGIDVWAQQVDASLTRY